MNKQAHISDDEIRQVVFEQKTTASQSQIENHISTCADCQERLLNFAADSSWREEFSSSLSKLPSLNALDETNPGDFQHDTDAQNRSGDQFDLQTVDRMLGEVLHSPAHPEMLGRLGRYDIEGVIGCGGMGVVIRGFDRDLHRPVAIKMILPRLAKNGTAKQRFAREARAAAAVLHPNVIAIHGIDESEGVPWFVMPLVAGPSLKKLVEENGPLPEKEVVRIGMQIASGLAAAHSQGLVHRDIKPENILVDNQINRVVITDFGLACRESDESMTQTGWLAGTLNYMSPEQSRGDMIDARSDLFSLGSLLFYLSAGEVPFRSSSAMGVIHKIGNENPPNVQSLNNEISSTLADVINRLLEKDPSFRFQSAVELETFFNDYLAHLHQPLHTTAPVVPGKRKNNRAFSWSKVIGSTALTIIVAAVAWWGIQNWNAGKSPRLDPNSASPALRWKEIADRYELEAPQEFHQSMLDLQQQIGDAIETGQNDRGATFDSHELETQFQILARELDRLDRALELPNSTGAFGQ